MKASVCASYRHTGNFAIKPPLSESGSIADVISAALCTPCVVMSARQFLMLVRDHERIVL